MPEETPTGENGQESQNDKERNFRELEADRDRWRERAQELEPLEFEKFVRKAGWDPDSAEGKVLVKDLGRGDVAIEDRDQAADVLRNYADNEYQWKPPQNLDPAEQRQLEGSQRLEALNKVSHSEQTAGGLAEIEKAILEAREAGDWARASQLQSDYDRKVAAQAG